MIFSRQENAWTSIVSFVFIWRETLIFRDFFCTFTIQLKAREIQANWGRSLFPFGGKRCYFMGTVSPPVSAPLLVWVMDIGENTRDHKLNYVTI